MLINEVIQQVDLTRRAVKFYEEKGLLKPSKDPNGYRQLYGGRCTPPERDLRLPETWYQHPRH